jgi:predicted regulator of Ras-like GTPase activity (Roadblock/LC7/MglB family)
LKHLLEPLACIPGVRTVALITPDGVPMCVHSAHGNNVPDSEEIHALSGLATGWIGEISRAVAPLSWDVPQRLVLQAARGTLVIHQAPGSLLLIVLEGGLQAEDLRLPMDVAVQRIQRHVRGVDQRQVVTENAEPTGLHPRRTSSGLATSTPQESSSTVHGTRSGGPEVPQVIGD